MNKKNHILTFWKRPFPLWISVGVAALATLALVWLLDIKIHNPFGIPLARADQFLWQVKVSGFSECGGVIVAENWVLTAAHCVQDEEQNTVVVYAGTKIPEEAVPLFSKHFYQHPKYVHTNPEPREYDLALIQLDLKLDASKKMIPMVDSPAEEIVEDAFVAGWACASPIRGALHWNCKNQLVYTDVQPLTRSACDLLYGGSFICAGGSEAGKTLPGVDPTDSGGGLTTATRGSAKLLGIANYTAEAGDAHARINKHRCWIEACLANAAAPACRDKNSACD